MKPTEQGGASASPLGPVGRLAPNPARVVADAARHAALIAHARACRAEADDLLAEAIAAESAACAIREGRA
ncbi:hypothetical protein [Paraconexibacter algicola]|uniref:Uncharacterized protein n=1 Tax=Paraconexibacter algicola TaxID=2133960 RepID=A0A2T4UE56_9ACTN|nr:hypothetical protein [Paraconexibacter algicola]PTL55781.1 hypothetical protein C7Y72_19320 [Paraconexibacter algicola]